MCHRPRKDLQLAVAALTTRVKAPTEWDMNHLLRLLRHINGTRDEKLYLSADNLSLFRWTIDASFAVHPDFKSQTGAELSLGNGSIL